MRIRKRTPARAAEPALPAAPPRPLPQQPQPKGRSREEDDEEAAEEKRVILVAGVRVREEDHDRVPAAVASHGSAMDDVLKPEPEPQPEPQPQPQPQGAVARCSRNDGKRWRCKSAAAPGYLFCERHIAWSSRKRMPRPKKHKKQHGSGGSAAKDEGSSAEEQDTPEPGHGGGDDEGFYGGLHQKRAKGGGPGQAA